MGFPSRPTIPLLWLAVVSACGDDPSPGPAESRPGSGGSRPGDGGSSAASGGAATGESGAAPMVGGANGSGMTGAGGQSGGVGAGGTSAGGTGAGPSGGTPGSGGLEGTGGGASAGGESAGAGGNASTDGATLVPDPSWTCGMPEGIVPPSLGELLFSVEFEIGAVHDIGRTQYGDRTLLDIAGGTISGPRLGGSIVQGGLGFELLLPNGVAEIEQVSGEHGIIVYTGGAVEIHATLGGCDFSSRIPEGSVRVLSGDDRPRYRRILGQADVTVVHLPTEWIVRALGERGPALFSRTAALGADETLAALAQQMLLEVKRGGASGPLFAESLSMAFISYAGSRLAPARPETEPKGRGFSRSQARRLHQFIASHLQDDLTLADLSAVVGLRPRHFSTLFNESFGCSPYRFVLDRKLSEAARLLSTTELDIAEIAYQVGFCSQSHFTAMFRRNYGVTPGKYAIARRSSVS